MPIAVFCLHVVMSRVFDAYRVFPGIDIPMHFLGGMVIAFFFHRASINGSRLKLLGAFHPFTHVLLVFFATCAATVFWEFAELINDRYFGGHSQGGIVRYDERHVGGHSRRDNADHWNDSARCAIHLKRSRNSRQIVAFRTITPAPLFCAGRGIAWPASQYSSPLWLARTRLSNLNNVYSIHARRFGTVGTVRYHRAWRNKPNRK